MRTLPQLQKLDNISVTQEELKEAVRKGKVLPHPEEPQDSEEEEYSSQNQQYQRYQEYSPQRSPQQEVTNFFYIIINGRESK